MTLEHSIDRATFRELVDVALRRIPTASRGQWTLHAPVDPGLTLVELLAWLLEQRAYWADQATAPLVRRVLGLFDGDDARIRGARSAGVVVTFEPELADPPAAAARISRRTVLRVPETEILFTLQHGLTALALARYPAARGAAIGAPRIQLAGVPGFDAEDLRSGRPVPLLEVGGPAEARIGIALQAAPPASAALPISILFELDTAVRPEWDPDAAPAAPPAALRWEYQDTTGAWRALTQLHDGTGGLRRSGVVRFALPRGWSAYGEERVGWLRVSTTAATFAAPPTVLRIAPNSALAAHAVHRIHREAPGWLPLPGRTLQLAPAPLPLPDRVTVLIDEPAGQRRWRVLPDLVDAGPADRVAVVDRARARVVFGDGLTGRVPRLADPRTSQATVLYAAGGGAAGNVPPCPWETVAAGDGGGDAGDGDGEVSGDEDRAPVNALPGARSLVPAIGGRDPETLDEARARATSGLQRPERAVTPRDHEVLARTTPGVAIARAHAEVGLLRGECGPVPGVTTVFVVPGIAGRTRDAVSAGAAISAPIADPGALAEVRGRLERARLVGEAILVEPAAYRRLRVRVEIGAAGQAAAALRQRVAGAIRLYLDPLLGGDEGTGWPFGQPVRPTALLGVAQRALGDRAAVTAVAVAEGGRGAVSCEDVAIQSHELIAVDAIEVTIDAALAAGSAAIDGGFR